MSGYKVLLPNEFMSYAIMEDCLAGKFIVKEFHDRDELAGFCLVYEDCNTKGYHWLCSKVDDSGFIFEIFDEPEEAKIFIDERLWLDEGFEINIEFPKSYMTRH